MMIPKQRNIVTRLRKIKKALEKTGQSNEIPYGPVWSALTAAQYALEAAAQALETGAIKEV